jgi:hypothetical protein
MERDKQNQPTYLLRVASLVRVILDGSFPVSFLEFFLCGSYGNA